MDEAEPIYQLPSFESQRAGPSGRDLLGIAAVSLFLSFWIFGFFQLSYFGIFGFLVPLTVFLPLAYLVGGRSARCPSCGVYWAKKLLREIEFGEKTSLQYLQCKLCSFEWQKTVTKGGDGCGCG